MLAPGISLFASLAHQHTQRLRCWLRGSTIVRPPQRISMTTVWIELSRFVMVFGDSHLRSLADGFVTTPLGNLRFGFSSTPGACAAILRKDILRETLPVEPDLVVILAPGNNLTKSNTIEQAGKEFATLIHSAQHRWNKLMWCAAYQQLFAAQETKPATTGLQSSKPGLTPRVVVRGSAPVISRFAEQ
ncbi:UNVERIFIED_CONTAM: hypothetical protein FKN15_054686 [Acipenser sinensis]